MRLAIAAFAVSLATIAMAQDAVGTRIAQAATAAQRLQGPLDGRWMLGDGRGRILYVFEIGDPPTGRKLSCAWLAPNSSPRRAECRRVGTGLSVVFEDADGMRRVVLRPAQDGLWRGKLIVGGVALQVSLRHG